MLGRGEWLSGVKGNNACGLWLAIAQIYGVLERLYAIMPHKGYNKRSQRGKTIQMPKYRKPEKKPIEQYDYNEASRANNPPIDLATPETDRVTDAARLIVPDVTDALLSNIVSKIVKHFHPEKIILFGSRA